MIPRAFAVIAVIAGATSVAAQPAPDDDAAARAQAADQSARVHYDAHDYAAAIADYRRAFEALPDPLFLFDIAQAYRQIRDCENASEFYRRYLKEQPSADNRSKVEHFITEMDTCAKEQRDARAATLPISQAAQPVDTTARDAALDGMPAPHQHATRLAGAITAAVGLAFVGVGGYFSSGAENQAHQLEQACAHGCDGSAVASIDRDGKDDDHAAIAMYVIGGAAIATGATLIVWAMLHSSSEPMIKPIVSPVPGGASIAAVFRF